MKYNDISNEQFGYWTVLEYAGSNEKKEAMWKCRCKCGTIRIIPGKNLRTKRSRSCGCMQREVARESRIQSNKERAKHGYRKTRLYNIWSGMKQRCLNPNDPGYKDYGSRGITICDEWKEFPKFKDWALNNGYADNLSIDRIEVDKGYSPDNCRWATPKTQNNNKRNNVMIEYKGKCQTVQQWSDETGIPYATILKRFRKNLPTEKIFEKKKGGAKA